MNDLAIGVLAHPHEAPLRHRPLGKCITLGMLATSALLAGCATSSESEETDELAQSFTGSPKTYMASVPRGNNLRPAMAASITWPGNIEAVRAVGGNGTLQHLYWAPGLSSWVPTATFGINVHYTSDPALCVFSGDGFMQVVVLEDGDKGQLRHYWRDNTDQTWNRGALFSQNCKGSPALINNRLIPTNLEVVVREDNYLKHIWRDENYVWQNESLFALDANVASDPALVQTADGRLHVLADRYVGDQKIVGHWIRDNENVWSYFGSVGGSAVWAPAALAVDDTDGSVFAILQTPRRLALYRFDGVHWTSAGTLGGGCAADPTQDCSSGPVWWASATTLNGNELHTAFFVEELWNVQHWRLQ